MIKPDRLRDLMAARGLSQSELARRVGVSQATIYKLLTGESYSSRHLHRIARELGTTPAYLTGEATDPSEGALPEPTPESLAEQLDLVPIPRINRAYGAGAAIFDEPEEQELSYFPRWWLETVTDTPATHLFFGSSRGDSMEPAIRDGDIILFDRSQRRVLDQDAIWALTIGDVAMIKRLRVRGPKVTIMSDNPSISDDVAHADEVNIVARVVFVGRRM